MTQDTTDLEQKKTILLVDDNRDNIITLLNMLQDEYRVQFATSGPEALALIDERMPDLVLLDVMMPDMDGYEVIARLHQDPRYQDLPVIFVTALHDVDNEERALSAGAVDFISKPVHRQTVLARVKTHLRLRQREQEVHTLNLFLDDKVRERTQQITLLNQALEQRTQQAEQANQAKRLFLNNMNHELRTPMSAILGFTDILRSRTTDPKDTQLLTKVQTAAAHLSATINDILNFSYIQSGKLTLDETPFEVRGLVEKLQCHFSSLLKTRPLSFRTHLDAALPAVLIGDIEKLEHILRILLANAIKFTPYGEIVFSVRRLQQSAEDVEVAFEIEDSGIGIDEDKLKCIFTAFEQADNSNTRQYGGTGLGLAISRKLIEMMGGRIVVNSVVGEGSTFNCIVTLKCVAESQPSPQPQSLLHRLQALSSKSRILLVDDDDFNLAIFSELLDEAKLAFDMANNGAEAVNKVLNHDYDLILMDVQMPIMDGLTATREIRKLPQGANVPIIAISANAYDEDKARCFEAGMNAFLAKPILPEIFYKGVLNWLKVRS